VEDPFFLFRVFIKESNGLPPYCGASQDEIVRLAADTVQARHRIYIIIRERGRASSSSRACSFPSVREKERESARACEPEGRRLARDGEMYNSKEIDSKIRVAFRLHIEFWSFKASMSISSPNGLGTEKGRGTSSVVVQLPVDAPLPVSAYKAGAIAFAHWRMMKRDPRVKIIQKFQTFLLVATVVHKNLFRRG